ncbi:MAG: phenylalanine--tRNA ligase subunit alpha, partial [Gammaproteobacteria bacterium]
MADPDSLVKEALQAIAASGDEKSLESLRVKFLGKKGSITALLKELGKLPSEQRPVAGEKINAAKTQLLQAIESRKQALLESTLNEQLQRDRLDVTLPGRRQSPGGLHPITITMDR